MKARAAALLGHGLAAGWASLAAAWAWIWRGWDPAADAAKDEAVAQSRRPEPG